ncbi:MAG TPA: hypothetical protein VIU16_00135 [Gaiellaceae bacterium]
MALLGGCGARPQQAVAVSRGPTVHYLLCRGERVTAVRLTRADGRPLWEIRSARGSALATYRVGVVPPGFRQVVPFRGLAPTTRVSGPDGRPAMTLTRPPRTGVLRGDGARLSDAAFAAGRSRYCDARRRDRAAALAVGFAFVVLALLFVQRWFRAKRSKDPFRRPWLLR